MRSEIQAGKKVMLLGNPNVGKSVVFRLLTGSYVLVSNFPGTTVEISRGSAQLGGTRYKVVDTPGVNSLVPQSEDERVTCEMLLIEKPDVILQIADAKNLRRALLLTSQLAEFGIPMALVLNMMDEAEERGIEIDTRGLADLVGIPVVETVAIYSQGKRKLLYAIENACTPRNLIAQALSSQDPDFTVKTAELIPAWLSVEWLRLEDRTLTRQLENYCGAASVSRVRAQVEAYRKDKRRSLPGKIAADRSAMTEVWTTAFRKKRQPRYCNNGSASWSRFWLAMLIGGLAFFIWNEAGALTRLPAPFKAVNEILASLAVQTGSRLPGLLRSMLFGDPAAGGYDYGIVFALVHLLFFIAPVVVPFGVLISTSRTFVHEIGILTRRASTGLPILVVALLLLYEFVGFTGAQTLVGLFENVLFGSYLLPFLRKIIPEGFLHQILVGRYGLISMGLTYAIAIVLPVVATFFIAFGLMEDSGYLPRLAVLSDRLMRLMGLNGKATLPMVLGLGCCTMATITTRILNTRKERLIATLLLALGIPCSAQLGVILGISATFSFLATLIVIGVVASQLLIVGFLSSRIVRGRPSEFIFEIPPIRVPLLKNVLLKTGYRVKWYLVEAVPLFLYGTLALFFLDYLHLSSRSLLEWIQKGMEPVLTGILSLPAESASVFVLGFLRRDYGAAGLFTMARQESLTAQQAVVSLIVITLFVPCLASFLVIIKEQGLKKALAITGFIIPFAVGVGGAVSWILRTLQISFH